MSTWRAFFFSALYLGYPLLMQKITDRQESQGKGNEKSLFESSINKSTSHARSMNSKTNTKKSEAEQLEMHMMSSNSRDEEKEKEKEKKGKEKIARRSRHMTLENYLLFDRNCYEAFTKYLTECMAIEVTFLHVWYECAFVSWGSVPFNIVSSVPRNHFPNKSFQA